MNTPPSGISAPLMPFCYILLDLACGKPRLYWNNVLENENEVGGRALGERRPFEWRREVPKLNVRPQTQNFSSVDCCSHQLIMVDSVSTTFNLVVRLYSPNWASLEYVELKKAEK